MCLGCQKSKVHFTYRGSDMVPRSVSGMKWKENTTMALVSLRGGVRQKRAKKVVARVASAEEVEAVLGDMISAGPSWPVTTELVAQIFNRQLGQLVTLIDQNVWVVTCIGTMIEGVTYELQMLADQANQKGKGKAKPEEVADEANASDESLDREV